MKKHLLTDFNPVSAKAWKQKIQVDLKGAEYNETLISKTLEGIHIKPFYHNDDGIAAKEIPGTPSGWNITQGVFIDDVKIANNIAIDALEKGAEAIIFTAEKPFNIPSVFKDFPFSKATIYFDFSFLDFEFVEELSLYLNKHNAEFYLNLDPIGKLSKEGNWFKSQKEDFNALQSLSQTGNTISVDTTNYQNAGANMVQQLAYALAHANEYLNHQTTNSITFKIATGTHYFFEIAKIRALRILYASLAKEYDCSQTCHVIAQPSRRNKTVYDYNINMLRSTTEAMSSVFGGADAVCNMPYDVLYHKSNEFGERISRNQLLILKAESYFDVVSNPADGAYYIESVTQELASKALELFKQIEDGGGFIKQLLQGDIQKKIKESASKQQALFDNGSIALLGTNKHPNPMDLMKENLELFPFLKSNPRKTLIQPIIAKRLAEAIEQERLSHE
ncbi:methylmalonyl-CoA mutase subunit beta [Flavobacteriaceae bacterium]|nr:methylmalonyl-CoA mutase subunit beta [Flavobacteriaceae bacterium]